MARVTLLTDFGTRDGYVGALKGVIAASVPGAVLDDVSHDVPRGDVRSASYALARYWRLYPEATVHLAVVDPGVGTARRPLACEADGRLFVAPDNGVLSRVLAATGRWRAVEIKDAASPVLASDGASATFHGRDVFAPTAAFLATGGDLSALGPPLEDPVRHEEPSPVRVAAGMRGVVVAVDLFGNLLTNLPGASLEGVDAAEVAARRVPVVRTYGDGSPGEIIALVSSDGRVEFAVRDGSAAAVLAAGPGTEVLVPISK